MIQGVGMGLLYCTYVSTILDAHSTKPQTIFQFPVMAPLPISENASAVALVTFVRAFSQAWGVAISGTILQNSLRTHLPSAVLSRYSSGAELAYAVIPDIPGLPPPLRLATQKAFADSLHVVWVVMVCLCGAGMLSVVLMKEFSLRKTTDKQWGLREKTNGGDQETGTKEGSEGKQDGESVTSLTIAENDRANIVERELDARLGDSG